MSKWIDIRFWLMASLTLLIVGCESDDYDYMPPVERSSFMLYVYLPEESTVTRAEIAAEVEERAINSLQVWVFGLDANKAPKEITEAGATSIKSLYVKVPKEKLFMAGSVVEVAFDVSDDFKANYPYVDAYAIVNAESLGLDLSESTTKAELEDLKIATNQFGILEDTRYPHAPAVTAAGLPMSGYLKEAQVAELNEMFTIANMTVTRAVSKIRFVFTKADDIYMASVSNITLDGHRIFDGSGSWEDKRESFMPSFEYLFSGLEHDVNNDGNPVQTDYSLTYLSGANANILKFAVPADVPGHPNPWLLRWDNEVTAQEWEDKINYAIYEGKAVEGARAYLRETPRCVIGEIEYSVQDEEGGAVIVGEKARFSMNAENEFLRNHSWTILAYFSEGGVVVEVADWDKQDVDLKPFK